MEEPIKIEPDVPVNPIKSSPKKIGGIAKPFKHLNQEEKRIEVQKCKADFYYFCRKYVFIHHPIRGFIKFDLFPFQERVFENFQKARFNIVKKPRQMGLSTLTSVYLLWMAAFQPAKEIMIVSIGSRESKEFLKHIKVAYERCPEWLVGPLDQDNKSTMVFTSGSRIQSIPSPKYAARSFAASFLVIDEAAFIDNIESLWTSAFPILSTGGKAIVLSTVNGTFGAGQWFYFKWKEAELKLNNFNSVSLNYWEHPDYDSKDWAEQQKRDLGDRKFAQEVLCDFAGSIETFIPADVISKYLSLDKDEVPILKDPISKTLDGKLWIWNNPEPNHFYIIGVDCAKQGIGKSNSTFQIIDINTSEQVAEFCGKIDIREFAAEVYDIATLYNKGFVILEINNMGLAAMNELYYTLNYHNIYHRKGGIPGWETTVKTRPLIIEALEQVFIKDLIKIKSIRTINELQTFARDEETGKVEKQRGATDDLVIALGLSVMGIQQALLANPTMKSMLLPDFGDEKKDKMAQLSEYLKWTLRKDPYIAEIKLEDGRIIKEDIRWLIT